MRHENAPKNREIFDKLEEAGRLMYEGRITSWNASLSKGDEAALYRISNIAEKILIDFGEEYHNHELLCWETDVDRPTMQWPHMSVSGKFSRVSIRKWLPSFYKEGEKRSYGCDIHYHTEGKSPKNESQILLPPDISDSDGAELRLWDEHADFDCTRLLSELDGQSLLADLDQLYEIKSNQAAG